MKANYQLIFIISLIYQFYKDKEDGEETFIIPLGFSEITKGFASIQIFYCELKSENLEEFAVANLNI